jgi:SRSO17 transposase
MSDTAIVASFHRLLQEFSPCFTAPSFSSFLTLMTGWGLNLRRHTITETVRAAGAVGLKDITSFHRFFSRGRWLPDALGLVLIRLVVEHLLPANGPIVAVVDDTLGRHTGKKIAGAAMHRDPLLSTATRVLFHWGHVWVVLGVNVKAFGKTWCLPILLRLYRTQKQCQREKRSHRKKPELARELIGLLASTLPDRTIRVLGDADYTNRSVIQGRPSNVQMIGRARPDAALYAPAPPRRRGQMGRPVLKGKRLPSPEHQAGRKNAPWQRVKVSVYGKTAWVQALVIDALWYRVAGTELVRLVVVRDFPGHERDDVFVSTDVKLNAKGIIEGYSQRWPLEVTFQECKGRLGFEDPQNRLEHAVERTAPMALWAYTLVVLWYVKWGQYTRAARVPHMPWYPSKAEPAFSDMLATLRRASWLERLSVPCRDVPTLRKVIRPILEYVAA